MDNKIMIGTVLEVFIPKEIKNGIYLDVMESTKIGFKVKINDKEITIIENQNGINSSILKNSKVIIKQIKKNRQDIYTIEPYTGDKDE